jgi:zinc transporter ZupT
MNHTKHLWLMLVCCLVPLGLIVAVSVFGVSLGTLTPLLPYALALMCPLMMLVMMRGMMHDHNVAPHQHDQTVQAATRNEE